MMGSASFVDDFRRTHHFCSGVVCTTVYTANNSKLIDSENRIVMFEKGTNLRGDAVQRLAIYRGAKWRPRSTPSSGKLCHQIPLNESDLCGLIKGLQSRRLRYSKFIFSPTVTIVTKEATVVLMSTETDYEQSIRQHDIWYNCLETKLRFGGYWSVEHESATGPGGSSSVTLCVSQYRLSLLAVSPDDEDLLVVKAEYRTSNIVCWKLHFANHQKCRIAYLSVTVAPDGNPANCNFERLLFRIDHNETVASDISEVFSRINLPRMQRAIRRQLMPPYLDLQLRQSDITEQLSSTSRRQWAGRGAAVGKRRSRDDMDIVLGALPVCPPPRLPPRTQPHQHVLNSYDLNALSCTDSVKDAVNFYENVSSVRRQRPRSPPDVVASHLDEDEEYWSIVLTLREVLKRKKPEPDTLGLKQLQRLTLCIFLLDESVPSWRNLADHIGLTQEAVRMIETLFQWTHASGDDVTPTECVLRHWQYVYNRSLVTGPTSCHSSCSSSPPCTMPSLINILGQIGRHDLVRRLTALLPGGAEDLTQE